MDDGTELHGPFSPILPVDEGREQRDLEAAAFLDQLIAAYQALGHVPECAHAAAVLQHARERVAGQCCPRSASYRVC